MVPGVASKENACFRGNYDISDLIANAAYEVQGVCHPILRKARPIVAGRVLQRGSIMKRWFLAALVAWLVAASAPTLFAQDLGDPPAGLADGVEAVTRGPLHEAFAEPVTLSAEDTLVIDREPPAPVDEVPPEYKPDDDDAIWIPGYWAWDEERDDFLWISGVWRVPPPGQRWVAGYWQATSDSRWQWVPGFWITAEVEQITYYPPPPESLEAGPTSPAPGDDYFYVPGTWQYYETGYRWQPGYWHVAYTDWMWVPARWCWTPRGVVFLQGYWDYRLPQRGFVFAPVYFSQPVWRQPNYFYRPSIVLNTTMVFNHLFVRPGYRHYYFGDWYGDRYARYNIWPAYQWASRRGGYDPVVNFYSTLYRQRGQDFIAMSRDRYRSYVQHVDRRPPHTWNDVARRLDRVEDRQDLIAHRLRDVARDDRQNGVHFVKLEDKQQQKIREQSKAIRHLQKERTQLERATANARDAARDNRPSTSGLKLPKVAEIQHNRDRASTPQHRPGRDDVPRPVARNDRDQRPGVADRDRPNAGNRPDSRPGARDRDPINSRDIDRERPNIGNRPNTRPGVVDRDPIGGRDIERERPNFGNRPGVTDRDRDVARPNVGNRPELRDRDRERPQVDRTVTNNRPDAADRPNIGNRPDLRDDVRRPQVDRSVIGNRGERTNPSPRVETQRPNIDRRPADDAAQKLREREAQIRANRPQPNGDRQQHPPRPDLRPVPKQENRPQARVEQPRPQPRTERPQPQQRVERPQLQQRPERPQPRPEPQRQARAERPQPQPRPQPRAERPQPQPRPEKPHPNRGGNPGPKKDPKDKKDKP
jgi:hypothetical protein